MTEDSINRKMVGKKKVEDLTKTYIRNFDSLKHTFSSAPKPSFFNAIDSNISDNMRGYLREFNVEPSEEERTFGFSKFRKFKQVSAISLELNAFVNDFEERGKEMNEIQHKLNAAENRISEIFRDKMRMESEIARLEKQEKNNAGTAESLTDLQRAGNLPRMRGLNFDVVEYASKRMARGSGAINPLFVIKASLMNIDKPLNESKKQQRHWFEKLEAIKRKRNQLKGLALECVDFFLANPQFLDKLVHVKLTLQQSITCKIRLGESVYPI